MYIPYIHTPSQHLSNMIYIEIELTLNTICMYACVKDEKKFTGMCVKQRKTKNDPYNNSKYSCFFCYIWSTCAAFSKEGISNKGSETSVSFFIFSKI